MKLININEMQMPTWRWLKMNSTQVEVVAEPQPFSNDVIYINAEQVKLEEQADLSAITDLPADLERMLRFVLENQNHSLTVTIPKGVRLEQPVYLEFLLDKTSPQLVNFLHIKAEAGSQGDVIVSYRSIGDEQYFHGGFTYLEADPDASVHLIKTQMFGDTEINVDMTAVKVAAGAGADVTLVELGAKEVVSGCNILLDGAESRSNLDCLYMGSGNRKQDFNYRTELRGESTEGEMVIRGALTGQARKLLKCTLDFVSGASGSKGREEETVLTLSDKAVNLTVPLLLCGEDNVEGEHATTTGKPDAQKLFYLMSRGFSELDAKRLLVEASFTPIINKIPSEELCRDIFSRVREVVHHDE